MAGRSDLAAHVASNNNCVIIILHDPAEQGGQYQLHSKEIKGLDRVIDEDRSRAAVQFKDCVALTLSPRNAKDSKKLHYILCTGTPAMPRSCVGDTAKYSRVPALQHTFIEADDWQSGVERCHQILAEICAAGGTIAKVDLISSPAMVSRQCRVRLYTSLVHDGSFTT